MKKQVKKWLTLTMAFALILGSISYNPLAANATAVSTVETENSVTGNDADGIVSGDVGGVIEDMDTVSGTWHLCLIKRRCLVCCGMRRQWETEYMYLPQTAQGLRRYLVDTIILRRWAMTEK